MKQSELLKSYATRLRLYNLHTSVEECIILILIDY